MKKFQSGTVGGLAFNDSSTDTFAQQRKPSGDPGGGIESLLALDVAFVEDLCDHTLAARREASKFHQDQDPGASV
ncbi:unnamed protein product [Ectocarpus sp. CCAP 1310/34]|nr:unnamed protein product [Ectocarpus sp. CCAP 1310/34]